MSPSARSPIDVLLKPGLSLMRRLNFPAKMAVLSLTLVVPMAVLMALTILPLNEQLSFAQGEQLGSNVVIATLETVHLAQTHRSLTHRALAGDAAAQAQLEATRAALKPAIAATQAAVDAAPALGLAARWQPVRRELERLAAGELPSDAARRFALQTEQIQAMRDVVATAAEKSGLILDPEATTYQLMLFTVEHAMPWTETLGRLHGEGAARLGIGAGGPDWPLRAAAYEALLGERLDAASRLIDALGRSGEPAPKSFAQAVALSREFVRLVDADFAPGATLAPDAAAAYVGAGAQAIAATHEAAREATSRLDALLAQRIADARQNRLIALVAGLATLLGVAYLTLAFFRTSRGAVRVLQDSVRRLASGDFATRIQLRRTDELNVVGRTLDEMTGRLSAMVADIRSNSSMVTQAGMKLAVDTKALSERTEAQAASLEETSASVHEITSAVQRSAEGAQAADALAARVCDMAESGGAAIRASVTSMQDIEASSRRVQEIIGVIEGIAFQTNILALNAAVEAARAGEQGRGFAVVASEVRTLAQRSSDSAREIKALIGESVTHVDAGVREIGAASQTFTDIVQGIREVAQTVRHISEITREQSGGLGQIAQAVQHLDELTQRNAQMVEQALHSSAQLRERAELLSGAVASFRLRQGSADEAYGLVTQAVELYQARGESALELITTEKDRWTDRDMYVFAFDAGGVYRAFGGNRAKVGTSVRDVPGVDGDQLVRDAFERASFGGGWVDYNFTNPQTGQCNPKTSYVVPVRPDLVIGCGVYKTGADAQATATASSSRHGSAAEPVRPAPVARRTGATVSPSPAAATPKAPSRARAAATV